MGERNSATANSRPVTTEVRPVLPPAITAGGAFHVGADSRCTQNRTQACTNRVGHQCATDTRQSALFIQHIRFGSNTDEGSHGIKQVNKQEREHNCDEIQAKQAGEVHLHQCRFQRRDAKTAGKIRQYRVHSQFWIGLINTSYLQKDAQQPCAQDTQQNTARYFF